MITILLIGYAVLVLTLISAIANSARLSMPGPKREDELLQLMLRTELRSKPIIWHMEEAA